MKKKFYKPTPKQKKLARALLENEFADKPLPRGKLLENVGYGQISKDPSRIINTQGVQTALQEIGLKEALIAQGVDGKKIAEKVNVLLEAKTPNGDEDFNAIDKGLKHATAIHGLLQQGETKIPSGNTYNFIFSTEVQDNVRKLEEAIKEKLINPNDKKV